MIKIEKEYVSSSGTKYVRTLDAKPDQTKMDVNEKIRWKSENRRIRRGRYLSMEQWLDIEKQVEEAYAMEYDVDFTSIFDIYPKDYRGSDGVIFYETYYKGDEQFGHSSNVIHIGAIGSYVPDTTRKSLNQKEGNYTTTKTASFKFYADKAAQAKADAQMDADANEEESEKIGIKPQIPDPQHVVKINYAALGIKA
jgi:hypothetical protein